MRHARKDVVAAASAKRLHALLSAGVKQLGKEIIVVLQFYASCITTEQAMHCIIKVTLLDEMHGFVHGASLREQHAEVVGRMVYGIWVVEFIVGGII